MKIEIHKETDSYAEAVQQLTNLLVKLNKVRLNQLENGARIHVQIESR